MSEELLPCPFCGSRDVFIEKCGAEWFDPYCNQCGATLDYGFTHAKAVKKWNTRAPQWITALKKLDACQEAIDNSSLQMNDGLLRGLCF